MKSSNQDLIVELTSKYRNLLMALSEEIQRQLAAQSTLTVDNKKAITGSKAQWIVRTTIGSVSSKLKDLGASK